MKSTNAELKGKTVHVKAADPESRYYGFGFVEHIGPTGLLLRVSFPDGGKLITVACLAKNCTPIDALWSAQFETRHFTLEAYAPTPQEAIRLLKLAWAKHCRHANDGDDKRLETYRDDIQIRAIPFHSVFMDRERYILGEAGV